MKVLRKCNVCDSTIEFGEEEMRNSMHRARSGSVKISFCCPFCKQENRIRIDVEKGIVLD